MQVALKKAMTVALAAVVVFMMVFPVPIGVQSVDRARYERADANPAIAVPVIVGTALAAYGVYVAGTSASDYNVNLGDVYSGLSQGTQYYSNAWATYVQEQGSFDAAMQSAITVDGQSINLGVLEQNGFFDTVNSYSAYLVSNGDAVIGSTSASANEEVFTLKGLAFPSISEAPEMFASVLSSKPEIGSWSNVKAYQVEDLSSGLYIFYCGNTVSVSNGTLHISGNYSYEVKYLSGTLKKVTKGNFGVSLNSDTGSASFGGPMYVNSAYNWDSVLGVNSQGSSFHICD